MAAAPRSNFKRSVRAVVATTLAALAATAIAACAESKPEEPARVDSTDRFAGERRKVAATLEVFERAVLASDIDRICKRLLRVRESRDPDNDNGGLRFCVTDPANDPGRQIRSAGGEARYDVVVRRIDLLRGHGRLSKRGGRALARVEVGRRLETFLLGKSVGRWEVIARSFRPRGFDTEGPRLGCGANAMISVFARAPKRSWTPREAVSKGPFSNGIRRTTSRGGSLTLSGVTYAPDYRHAYLLRDIQGRPRRAFPVTVFGLGSLDASEALICSRRDAERIARAGRRPVGKADGELLAHVVGL
jgi:hypothetical protein